MMQILHGGISLSPPVLLGRTFEVQRLLPLEIYFLPKRVAVYFFLGSALFLLFWRWVITGALLNSLREWFSCSCCFPEQEKLVKDG